MPPLPQDSSAPRPRVLAVWSRRHLIQEPAGRDKLVAGIKEAMQGFPHHNLVLENRLALRGGPVLFSVLVEYVFSYLLGRTEALQVLLFHDRRAIAEICAEAQRFRPDVIVIDTIRLIHLADALRRQLPAVPIVLDIDDLMSRRYGEFIRIEAPLNFGFVSKLLPRWLVGMFQSNRFVRMIYRSEQRGLLKSEAEACCIAQVFTFVSGDEAKLFLQAHRSLAASAIRAIVPYASVVRDNAPALKTPFRFIFLGTDRLFQNTKTIDYLLDVWQRRHISTPLVIYGKMHRAWPDVANVTFAGFAPKLDDVYAPGSILLTPSFVKGGVKTKVVEAFGFGVPVIGNETSFEGICGNYPLCMRDEGELEALVGEISAHTERLREAQLAGLQYVLEGATRDHYIENWQDLLDSTASMDKADCIVV